MVDLVEIMLNHRFGDSSGLPELNRGEIYLKPPNVDQSDGNLDIPSVIHNTTTKCQNIQFNHDGEPDVDGNMGIDALLMTSEINSDLGDDGGGDNQRSAST